MSLPVKKILGIPPIDFVILGGGISGLTSAFYIRRLVRKQGKDPKIVVLEGSERLGGWINSVRTPEGAVHELGPRTVRPSGPAGQNTLNLLSSLNFNHTELAPVLRKNPAAKNRFIYANGKLNKLPNSIVSLLVKQEPFSKSLLSQVWREPFIPKSQLEDESVYDFCHRRLGPEITDYMVTALCRGIYAGNAKELSVRSCFPMLYNYEQKYGSLVKGAYLSIGEKPEKVPFLTTHRADKDNITMRKERDNWAVWSLQGGLQALVEKLEKRLQIDGVEILTGQTCSQVEFVPDEESGDDNKVAIVRTSDGMEYKAGHVISAIPSHNLGPLLEDDHLELSEALMSIKSVTVATVNLEYDGNLIKEQGFGYLVPSNQPSQVLGVVFDSCALPQLNRYGEEGTTRLTCMMGGAWFEELFGDPNNVDCDRLKSIAIETVRDHLGITASPIYSAVNVQPKCIPNYQLGHHQLVDDIDGYIANQTLPLTLLGASYKGVSVNDCIFESMKAVQRLTRIYHTEEPWKLPLPLLDSKEKLQIEST